MFNDSSPGELIRLNWRDGNTTEFVAQILIEFNKGNRVIFLCEPSSASAVMNRIRMRISRSRGELESKGILQDHFSVKEYRFPYTNSKGRRFTAIVLRKFKSNRHKLKETVEGLIHEIDDGRFIKIQIPSDETEW